ncbi:MAG: hypothetical protein SGJ27_13085 [Candidatus Melainabacteria bacterium]|nr:hypothetical protein [Candidatus Melainabacteria bacterium]
MHKITATALSILMLSLLCQSEAEARRFGARGANGAAGGFSRTGAYGKSAGIGGVRYGRGAAGASAGSFAGPNGGTFRGARGGFVTPNAGAVGGAYAGTSAAGGSYQGAGGAAWKRGVGGVAQTGVSGTTASGNQYAGYKKGAYDAQTGQGAYNSGKSYTNAQTGQQYGYDQNTDFTRGQGGATTIDTQNKGDYQVDWQKGQKPTVTQTSAPTGTTSTEPLPTSATTY